MRIISKEELLDIFFSGFPAVIAAAIVTQALRTAGVKESIIKWAAIASGAVAACIFYMIRKLKKAAADKHK